MAVRCRGAREQGLLFTVDFTVDADIRSVDLDGARSPGHGYVARDLLARVNLECARLPAETAELTAADIAELPDLGSAFNDLLLWRSHAAKLRLAGLGLD